MGGFLILTCLPSEAPRAWGTFHLSLTVHLSLQLLPGLWGGGAGQVLSHELINDGPAVWGHKLGDAGLPISELRFCSEGSLQLVVCLVSLGASLSLSISKKSGIMHMKFLKPGMSVSQSSCMMLV